eukprot:Protomagalhaensia_sp_Gyna_25__186@NODE_108_length_5211_cov_17_314385_g85_i0_p2_GENE_NODE_108_length_5211_cov_17_314385_g85_i0NODE_108_length_5211_cov_17_314385_g85_i0_p2_ORF_typecomplete_len616_score122_49TFIIB/PF00382_19/3_3e15TFIIB/PF00382_19/3_7e12BRF1/PF07741_13/27BRF1/PF07741_13/1_3e06TF_Zn_Ribbon/PF08271_12/8_1e07Prim_Zn_Ribbon/PF08273_12/0_024DZR/PF12773_7/0_093Zn_Tnp_IS1595/PF12760_7/0_2Nudix_N_2/PF14803_6/0_85zfISL3/PF14690_6/0_9_NODE_108_length_5211_cov_17_314385_g85_i033635162
MAAGCPHCGSTGRARNDDRGEEICTGCGTVLSESAMVDQLTFVSGGRMVGSFVDTLTGATRGFAALYGQRASRQQTLQRGWYNLERVAQRLGLASSLVEAAKRMYHLALNRNFTLGRNNLWVVSACLYAACRRDGSAYMMIDFSDAVLAPVRSLTQVFMKLIRALRLNVPSVDPSLFMERFAGEMKLGDLTMQVAATGVRLVQAMARDWLVTGRRPLGLCAAALLIAARFHGRKLNSEDIDAIFRVSYSTVDKRLHEFQRTAAAALPAKDFAHTDLLALPALALPPCVIEQERRAKRRLALQEESHSTSNSKGRKRRKALEAAIGEQPEPEEPPLRDTGQENSEDVELAAVSPLSGKISLPPLAKDGACRDDLRAQDVAAMAAGIAEAIAAEGDSLTAGEKDKLGEVIRDVGREAPQILDYIHHELASLAQPLSFLMGPSLGCETTESTVGGSSLQPSQEVPEMNQQPSNSVLPPPHESQALVSASEALVPVEEEDLSLSDVDEALVESLMLSAADSRNKQLIWDELTRDYIGAVYERQDERRVRAAAKSGKPLVPRKRREPLPPMATAVEAVKASLGALSFSYQKNLDETSLEELFAL